MLLHAFVLAPLEALVTFGLIWWNIGLPTLFGYAVLLLLVHIQLIFSRQFSRYRKTTMACTDNRVQTINELVSGCQIIKMYNWEKAMEKRVRETRRHELSNIYKASCLRALNIALSFSALPLICLATFGGSWLMGRTLLPENIFATLAFFAMVRIPVTFTLPYAIEKFSEARVSARRIDQFMQVDILLNKREKVKTDNRDHVIKMADASFSWKDIPSLFSLNLKIKRGDLVGVKGAIGTGVNLSGGQKARISLARCLYADADLYLLDDPFAAVDPKVAKKIFDQCIGPRSLLRGKTRILVTHQTHFLVEADQMMALTDGHIDELHIEQRSTTEPSNDTSEADSYNDKQMDWTLNTATTDMNSIVKNEISFDGAIKWSVWLTLFTSPPLRWFGFLLLIFFMLGNEALYDFTNSWLALWSSKDKTEQRSSFYAHIYLGVIIATLFIALIRVGFSFYIMLRGSTYLHNRMLKGILYTSLRFFESNPSGRILNRASKDQQVLDESLPLTLIDTIQYLLMTLGSIIIIGMNNPWVLLILILLVPTVLWLRRFYMRSSRQLKRLESVTRSPIYSLFSSSLDGLTSIRAFDVQCDFLNMFIDRIDTNSRAYFILFTAARWFGLRLDLITSLLTLVTAILAVALRHQMDPSAAALSISYCISLTGLFQWAIRQSAEAENFMTSAERIHEYGQLVPESHSNSNKSDVLIQPADDWPSRGIIEFKDYTFRYRPELDPVLKNLNLRIESKEKIGIIGRTGMIASLMVKYVKSIPNEGCYIYISLFKSNFL
ncbi:unnamed protein product [Rotaria sp. Silwood1]|nr:unnamed protein product [Rotaria sp. Silwood1]